MTSKQHKKKQNSTKSNDKPSTEANLKSVSTHDGNIQMTFSNGNTFSMPILSVPLETIVDTDQNTRTFCKSFNVETSTDEEIQNFFDTFGFIVFDSVLTQEESEQTVSDIFTILETGTNGQFDRNDVKTWHNWPLNALEHFGNVSIPSIFSRQFLMNRQNPSVVKAFSRVFKLDESELIISHDRASFYRPPSLNPRWKTKTNVHLDLNPAEALDEIANATTSSNDLNRLHYSGGKGHWIAENNHVCTKRDGLQVQGLINLADNESQDGGFICVPGFHKYFADFFEGSGLTSELGRGRPSFTFDARDNTITKPIASLAQRIPSKRGSIIIWNQMLPHGSMYIDANKSYAPYRSAMYLRMFPREMLLREGSAHRRKNRRDALRKKIHHLYIGEKKPLELTPLGRLVFDIDNGDDVFDPIPPFASYLDKSESIEEQ